MSPSRERHETAPTAVPESCEAVSPVVPTVCAADVLDGRLAAIDLRSPAEFAADHLPGAISVPLFGDEERAIIGTLYKQESPEAAFRVARERARASLAGLLARVDEATERPVGAASRAGSGELESRFDALTADGIEALERALVTEPVEADPRGHVVFHCWRGGLRSRSVVAFLRALGFRAAVALEGGYKSYRGEVRRRLAGLSFPPAVVLRGLTGVGKTLVLREIERLRPGWTVDLEALAGHRSSILGMVGLEPCTQKRFESRLVARSRDPFGPAVVFEGESRKVGDVVLPERLWEHLGAGVNVELVASTERRVDVLIDDYLARDANRDPLRRQLPFIEERLGPVKWRGKLVRLLDERRERELVEVLLERYYDPLYRHSEAGRGYALTLDADDPPGAAERVVRWVEDGGAYSAG